MIFISYARKGENKSRLLAYIRLNVVTYIQTQLSTHKKKLAVSPKAVKKCSRLTDDTKSQIDSREKSSTIAKYIEIKLT